MTTVSLVGGPYEGAEFTFAERLPDRIEVAVDCVKGDGSDTELQETIRFNLSGNVDGVVVMRDAESFAAHYVLESAIDGAPYYRYSGWRLCGANVQSKSNA